MPAEKMQIALIKIILLLTGDMLI